MKLAIRIVAMPVFSMLMFADKGDNEKSQEILPQLATSTQRIISTVPANGDVNPYGVAFVPNGLPTSGSLEPGDILVSNLNNSANLQGTGTTIVRSRPRAEGQSFSRAKLVWG